MTREIPQGSVEIQIGLYAYLHSFIFLGKMHSYYKIYSAEGYYFWEVKQPENYDEKGNLKPKAERVYAQYASTAYKTIKDLNDNFISIPIENGFDIVS